MAPQKWSLQANESAFDQRLSTLFANVRTSPRAALCRINYFADKDASQRRRSEKPLSLQLDL